MIQGVHFAAANAVGISMAIGIAMFLSDQTYIMAVIGSTNACFVQTERG